MVTTSFILPRLYIEGWESSAVLHAKLAGSSSVCLVSQRKIAVSPPIASFLGCLGNDRALTEHWLPEEALRYDHISGVASSIATCSPDVILAIGGGTAIDAAKAVRHRLSELQKRKILLVAMPTTAGTGAEFSAAAVYHDGSRSEALLSPGLIPDWVVKDPKFLQSVPKDIRTSAGCDAFLHSIESGLSPHASEYQRVVASFVASHYSSSLPRYCNGENDRATLETLSRCVSIGSIPPNFAGCGPFHAIGVSLAEAGMPHGLAVGVSAFCAAEPLCSKSTTFAHVLRRLIPNDKNGPSPAASLRYCLDSFTLSEVARRDMPQIAPEAAARRSLQATRHWANSATSLDFHELCLVYELMIEYLK